MKKEIHFNQIEALLPSYVSLCYVDYRESLSGSIEELQSCISENSWEKLYETIDDFVNESQIEGLECYKRQLKEDMVSKFDLDEDEADCLVYEKYQDKIEEVLYQKDDSDPLHDLLKNTEKFSFFFDTGLQIEDGSWNRTRSEQTLWLNKIKRKLKIEKSDWDDKIRLMLSQASYGGQLVIYFYDSVEELITDNKEKDVKSVRFSNPYIAIINMNCGSGDHTHLKGHRLTIPFIRENLFIDRYFKYNYVSQVCGMKQNWCEDSIAKFYFNPVKGKKCTPSPLTEEALQDKKYALTFSQGKCTPLDMDINRHRDTYYINDFPCGTKCPHCLTFWID